MKNIKRKGFTLVELLIVIVVIGILSSMMMMSSTEAVTSAKASNIVSNLRNLKTAALALYVDSMDKFDAGKTSPDMKMIVKYLNGGADLADSKDYKVAGETGTTAKPAKGGWYLQCTISGTTAEKEQIRKKLAGRAKSVGLLNKCDEGDGSDAAYDGKENVVYYFVR